MAWWGNKEKIFFDSIFAPKYPNYVWSLNFLSCKKMKNKLVLFGLIMGAAFLLSGCGQKANDTAKTDKAIEEKTAAEDSANSPASENNTSLKDLMAMGKSMECTWTTTDDKGKSSTGTVDISGSKFKMTLAMDKPDGTGKSNFYTLNDGTWVYSWGDAMKGTGMKISLADAQKMGQEAQNNPPAGSPAGIPSGSQNDWQKNYNYDCNPWEVSETAFTPPTDVNFVDTANIAKGFGKIPQ